LLKHQVNPEGLTYVIFLIIFEVVIMEVKNKKIYDKPKLEVIGDLRSITQKKRGDIDSDLRLS